jgi:hypothetical protein
VVKRSLGRECDRLPLHRSSLAQAKRKRKENASKWVKLLRTTLYEIRRRYELPVVA